MSGGRFDKGCNDGICKSKSKCNNTGIRVVIIVIILVAFFRLFIPYTSLFFRYIRPFPFSLRLSEHDIVMKTGEMHSLYVKGLNKRVEYSSSNFRVAGVKFTGKVLAYQPGTAFITAEVDDKELKCRVRVIDLNKDKLNMSIGNTYKLKVLGPTTFVKWKSSNEKIATVSAFGRVKAKKKGKTLVTAIWKGKKLKCNITIK